MQTIQLTIEGMSCGHCVARVRRALQSVAGVDVRSVDVGSAVAELDPARTKPEDLIRAVDDVGFVASLAGTGAA
jgi:copper chaperone